MEGERPVDGANFYFDDSYFSCRDGAYVDTAPNCLPHQCGSDLAFAV